MVQNRFRSGICAAKTRSFPGADVGSDHDLVILNFRVKLKKIKKPMGTRLKFNLDKLKDPTILEAFQATIGGKFAEFLTLDDNPEAMTTNFNSVITEAASKTLGKHRRKTQPWITEDILDMCDSRKELKRNKHTTNGSKAYRVVNKKIRSSMKKAKEDWIERQCAEVEENLKHNSNKKAFQVVKELTKQKQSRVNTIQDSQGHCLTETQDILNRWSEYCSDLYNKQDHGDLSLLDCQDSTNDDDYPILRDEVEQAIKSLKVGKASGVDNIPAQLIKNGGEPVTIMLL